MSQKNGKINIEQTKLIPAIDKKKKGSNRAKKKRMRKNTRSRKISTNQRKRKGTQYKM